MQEVETKNLVTRPFCNDARTDTVGISFSCDDCRGYFTSPGKYDCDKGKFIEQTEIEQCSHCGVCVDFCYVKARTMINNKL